MPIQFIDSVNRGLAQALTFHHQRQEVLATNIANMATPGYRANDLEFKDALRASFSSRGFAGQGARIVEKPSGVPRPDGNTVDVDMEMARLADNRGSYTTYANILARRLNALRRAIEGTR